MSGQKRAALIPKASSTNAKTAPNTFIITPWGSTA
jgi:hypothetical protein